jgi:hypothetical protein
VGLNWTLLKISYLPKGCSILDCKKKKENTMKNDGRKDRGEEDMPQKGKLFGVLRKQG